MIFDVEQEDCYSPLLKSDWEKSSYTIDKNILSRQQLFLGDKRAKLASVLHTIVKAFHRLYVVSNLLWS